MEKKLKLATLTMMVLVMAAMVVFSGCKKDDDPETPVTSASFQFEVNGLEVTFTNYSKNATSYTWDFGDGSGTSTEVSPTYTYVDGGAFTVTLTAVGAGGTATYSDEVTVIKPGGANLIQNGEFDDETIWNVLQHNPNNAGTLTIAEGVAVFNKGIQGEWGTEPHIGINQAVTAEAGTYQFDLDITTNGIDEVWFEVWVGIDEPVADADYNEDNGATKVLSFNTWECEDNKTYSGPMAAVSCQGTDGSITLSADTYYVVIRSGGITCSEDGIVIDNVKMVKID